MQAPPISALALGFFRRVVRGYFRRHFRAVRVAGGERFSQLGATPLIVYANHGSWWDPMVSVLLAARLMPGRPHYAPMDAAALERYGILKRIGVFGIETDSARGAANFLRIGLDGLRRGGALWVTPQGRFADARERPLRFRPGLARLAARSGPGTAVLPLAIEYVFWDERLPEVLLRFGDAVVYEGQAPDDFERELAAALEQTMQGLAGMAMRRDPAAFHTLLEGRSGTGGFYALGQRLISRMRGRRYQADHTAHPRAEQGPAETALCESTHLG